MVKAALLWMSGAALLGGVAGALPSPERPYKILFLNPYWSKSHKNVLMPLAEALASRGHEVTILTTLSEPHQHPNITLIQYQLPPLSATTTTMFDHLHDPTGGYSHCKNLFPPIARHLYTQPHVIKLYKRRKQFDLIVMNHLFSEVAYPFLYGVPFITVATPGLDPYQSAILGNLLNPSYIPNMLTAYPAPLSLWHRVKNTAMHLLFPFYMNYWAVLPLIQKEISAHFPDLPPLMELERNQSLTLINSHFSISKAVPLLPSQVEVGAMHCRPAKPLPEDLDTWLQGAGPAGVIYFSVGSSIPGSAMPPHYRQAFVDAFRRLPQRVLWKYEGELEGASDNVRVNKWLPQQDILAHPNVKVFISHGGLVSLQESIYHATPLLVLPIFSEQPRNAMMVEDAGVGRMLLWQDLTADRVVDAITDIIANPKYREKVQWVSAVLRDQLTTPVERAVFWAEYVIRHQGAPQLRCSAATLSWREYLLLDVVALVLLGLLLILLLLRGLLKLLCGALLTRRSKYKTA